VLFNEGIAVQNITDIKKHKCRVFSVAGNGEGGNYHVIKKGTPSQTFLSGYEFLSVNNANDKEISITDEQVNTWYEYQSVSIKPSAMPLNPLNYNINWTDNITMLRMKLIIELDDVQDINWLSLNPYYPSTSRRKVKINSVRVSENGIDYVPIGDKLTLNEEINLIPQSYTEDHMFDRDAGPKGVGVWNFPTKKAKFIELILDQEESYDETLGTVVYMKGKDTTTNLVVIPEKDVPENIVSGPYGKYPVSDGYIIKDVKPFDGYRFCIGIRDISVYGYKFGKKSEIVSKQYVSSNPITSVSLLANEIIPEEFLGDLTKANEWIQYYVSFDDVAWHRISPMHHSPYSDPNIPPKLITINQTGNDEMLNVLNIESQKDIYTVKFKAIMSRPEDDRYQMSTPILSDYALRCTVS
jgi:hypothetical protein